jgi:hypothetical protein
MYSDPAVFITIFHHHLSSPFSITSSVYPISIGGG